MQFILEHRMHIAAALAVAYVAYKLWEAGLFKGIKLPSFIGGGTATDNAGDFAALERLRARFVRLNCPEGKAACDVCLSHFFHGEEPHA